jgi:GntR family transcriptional regulator of vanillate catabolism
MTILDTIDRSSSESSKSIEDRVTLALREMLMRGEFVPGQKLVEAALADRLGVSRMPVRRALAVLERDGLVTNSPNRGSFVARFTLRQVNDARELRGSLEGLAARLVAERGLAPVTRRALEDMLQEGDRLFGLGMISPSIAEAYRQLNFRFHVTIVAAAENRPLMMAYEANNRLPLASPVAICVDLSNLGDMTRTLGETQADHHRIVAALKNGQGSRVEALMREHAQTAIDAFRKYAERLDQLDPATLPGLRLVIG